MSTPGKGIHSLRVFDFAIVDILGTLLAAFLIARWTGAPVWKVAVVLFIIGVIVHRALGIRTRVDKMLFPLDAEYTPPDEVQGADTSVHL